MGKNILLGVTASIASYKACDLVRMFQKKRHSVRCAMTKDAEHFVTPLTLETLSGKKVAKDLFCLPDKRSPEHIALSDESELILVAPATADSISKVAAGICDDVLTCTICSSDKTVVFAPAMNDKMFSNPIIQENIAYLKEKGYFFIDPVEGPLACGREGKGHLAPLEKIVEFVEKLLSR